MNGFRAAVPQGTRTTSACRAPEFCGACGQIGVDDVPIHRAQVRRKAVRQGGFGSMGWFRMSNAGGPVTDDVGLGPCRWKVETPAAAWPGTNVGAAAGG